MKYFFVAIVILSSQAFAKDLNLKCVATYNSDKVLEQEITLASGTRSLSFGEAEGFQFFLTHSGADTVELQALNMDEPSRSYATAKLTDASSFVELSIWKREFIMEARCTVI